MCMSVAGIFHSEHVGDWYFFFTEDMLAISIFFTADILATGIFFTADMLAIGIFHGGRVGD